MNCRIVPHCIVTIAMVFGLASTSLSQVTAIPLTNNGRAKPVILEKNEGELRTRRIHTDRSSVASSQFLLKVSPKNNGSQQLVMGSEELQPNARIPKHKHLIQDEILLIQTGTAHVWLGDQERDVHA